MKIETLIAMPAAGKTDAILSHVLETKEKAVIASPTRVLSEQSYNKFMKMGGRAVLIDSTRSKNLNSVQASIVKSLRDDADVLFITHNALAAMERSKLFNEYNLYIDEVPQMVKFEECALKSNLDLILQHCHQIRDEDNTLQELIVKPSEKPYIKQKIEDGREGLDDIDKALSTLYKALLDSKIRVMVKHNNGHRKNGSRIIFLNDNNHHVWQDFKKVTIACADLENSYSGKYLKHYAGCEFVESDLKSRLYFTEYKNTARVNIILMTDSDRWSRNQSNTNGTFERMVDMVIDECGDNFIYTVNKDREYATRGKGIRLPYGSHGLNSYIHHTNVAVLYSYNAQPWEIDILRGLAHSCNLPANDFVNARHITDYLDPAFQLCLRSNLRDNESTKEVNLYVPDWPLAEYIKQYFPDANIITNKMIQLECGQRQSKKSFKKMYSMSSDEAKRFDGFKYRMKKKGVILDEHDAKSVELVEQWIDKDRKYKQGWR